MSEAIPAPLADDDEDVSWALKTAAVQWKRGELTDAIQWLRRAVDTALEVGNAQRATELERVANELAERWLAAASSVAPPPVAEKEEEPPPSVRAILDSIHETLEEAASQGLVPDPIGAATPLTQEDESAKSDDDR